MVKTIVKASLMSNFRFMLPFKLLDQASNRKAMTSQYRLVPIAECVEEPIKTVNYGITTFATFAPGMPTQLL